MKSLGTLIRLRKLALDEARRELTDLERMAEQIEVGRRDLDREYAAESEAARGDVDASYVFGNYLETVRKRCAEFDRQDQEVSQLKVLAEAKVREAFREVKRIEIAESNRQDRERTELARQDQVNLDEVALSSFRRQEEG